MEYYFKALDLNLPYNIMDTGEVFVQFIAVMLLAYAVVISSKSFAKTAQAVKLSSKAVNFAKETLKSSEDAYKKQLQ